MFCLYVFVTWTHINRLFFKKIDTLLVISTKYYAKQILFIFTYSSHFFFILAVVAVVVIVVDFKSYCGFFSNNIGVLDWSFCWKFRRRPVIRVHILRWRNSRQNQALSNSQSRALRAGKGRGVRKSRNLWTRWKERPGNRGRTGEDTKWTVNFDILMYNISQH